MKISILGRSPIMVTLVLLTSVLTLTACTTEDSTNGDSPTTLTESEGGQPQEGQPQGIDMESSSHPELDSSNDHSAPSYGGQVVETGDYHLELVPIPEGSGIHLDFYLQTADDHRTIPDATVTAQVQLPDGSDLEIPMEYDAPGEHYFGFLPSQAPGDYIVVMLTEVEGTRTNARFRFSQ
ncbi:MAG: hypothetical protein JJU32_20350 [Phormidium sp. BM_Day4_Bin.17]|nr:hypothetical protein [Phormidium sp. BM_Day4_Bin.17]